MDEILYYTNFVNSVRIQYQSQCGIVSSTLSFLGEFLFSKYLPRSDAKHLTYLNFLIKKKGLVCLIQQINIFINLFDYSLSDSDKLVLSRGLDFCIPSKMVDIIEDFCEFVVLFSQLVKCADYG